MIRFTAQIERNVYAVNLGGGLGIGLTARNTNNTLFGDGDVSHD